MPKGVHDSPKGTKRGQRTRRSIASLQEVRKIMRIVEDRESMPMMIMIDNMEFWHRQARILGEELQAMPKPWLDNILSMAPILEKMFHAREMSQACAVQAAPYFHPRLAQIALTGADGGSIKHEHQAARTTLGALTDAELIGKYEEAVVLNMDVVDGSAEVEDEVEDEVEAMG